MSNFGQNGIGLLRVSSTAIEGKTTGTNGAVPISLPHHDISPVPQNVHNVKKMLS